MIFTTHRWIDIRIRQDKTCIGDGKLGGRHDVMAGAEYVKLSRG